MTSMSITSAVLERLAGSLLHFVWQGAAIAIVTAIALQLLRRRSAEWRYAVALGALATMLVAPFVTFAFYAETGALTLQLLRGVTGAVKVATSEAPAGDVALWTQRIVAVWIVGVVVFLARLVGGWLLSRRLVRSAAAVVTPVIKEALERAHAGLNFHGKIRLLTGERIESPIVIGWVRPAILLPASALTGLSADQLLAILSHELAHIRRHDFLVNGMQRAVECVLFYHPAVWWVSGRIRVERERCCDDLAVGVCGDRLIYAQALVALEKARSAEPVLALPTAGIGVKDRVRRILGVQGANRDWQSAAAALVFAAILVGAGMWQPPTLTASAVMPAAPAPQTQTPAATPTSVPAAPLNALIAIAAAQGVRPSAPASTTQVTQPTIASSREAARDRLGLLQVEYSAESFVKQAAEGDTIAVKAFLAAGMNINARNDKGYTALIKAAEMRQTETVQSLLAAGADPNLTSDNNSALIWAAWNGDLPTMKVLIAGGADVDLRVGANGDTALTSAASQGKREAVALLLDHKASIEAKGTARNALVAAACAGQFDVGRTLVDRGADVNARWPQSRSQTALGCAAQRRDVEFMRFLLDKGADINATSVYDMSPLRLALENNSDLDKTMASALLLIARGANVNTTPEPLERAVSLGLLEVVRALLDKGANPNKGYRPPLMNALTVNPPNADVAMLLIDRGADVNAIGTGPQSGMTPLLMAISSKQVGIIRALLAKGANPNLPGGSGTTPLRAASNSPEIQQLLIQAGAKP